MTTNPHTAIESAATSYVNNDQTEQIKKHKAIVESIKTQNSDETNDTSFHTDPDKISRKQNIAATQQKGQRQLYNPIFKWEKKDDDSFSISPTEKTVVFQSLYETDTSTNQMLSILGYKIDVSNQADQFKQKLQKFYIESKSYNPLVGKFSQLKYGMVVAILSVLGIDTQTMDKLKRKALKKAIQDNIDCFKQNEYNFELLTVFTSSRKDKGRAKVLTEMRKQLIKQMNNYDQPDFYTKEMITSIKKDQIKKIRGDLLEEKQNLSYIRNFQ